MDLAQLLQSFQAQVAAFFDALRALLPDEEPGGGTPEPAPVRVEGTAGPDAFEGTDARELFVLDGPDDVRGFETGADKLEADAAAIGGRSGEPLEDFATAVENGDLLLLPPRPAEGGEPATGHLALLFTDDGVSAVESDARLSAADWTFA